MLLPSVVVAARVKPPSSGRCSTRGATSAPALSQRSFIAVCTFQTQMKKPTIGIRFQKPVTPVTGFSMPALAYMLPISDGSRNQFTIPITMPITRPITPPTPSPVCCLRSRNTWYCQKR